MNSIPTTLTKGRKKMMTREDCLLKSNPVFLPYNFNIILLVFSCIGRTQSIIDNMDHPWFNLLPLK